MKVENIGKKLMLINGQLVESMNGEFIQVETPSKKGFIIAEVPRATEEDVEAAVQSATEAFEEWKKVEPRKRGKILLKIAESLEENADRIAYLNSLENGNAIRTQSRPEIMGAADMFRYFGGLASELKGTTYPISEGIVAYTRREPIGVVGGIIPWNAPILLAACKIAPAIAAGNTIVVKAAPEAPLAVLEMAKICSDHLIPGVVNMLTGMGKDCGAALANHPGIRKLSFTGSTAVGKSIMHAASDRIVPVSLELGGKSPQIVFPDSNDDSVVDGVVSAMRFIRQGQSCTAGSRLFVHESIFESFIEKLSAKVKELKVGDPLDEDTDVGAIVSEKQFNTVCSYIKEGLNNLQYKLVTGGLPAESGELSQGYFVEPTIFTCDSNDLKLAREEIFGPVLVVVPWKDEEEVIQMANDTSYGLAAFVWTNDIKKGLNTANRIESGWVQINRGAGQIMGHPYGGYKQSGIGKEFSLEGMLDSFTHLKSIVVDISQ